MASIRRHRRPKAADEIAASGIAYSVPFRKDEITSSAARLDQLDARQIKQRHRNDERWKEDAWRLYETLGEITQYADFYGKAMAKVQFVAGNNEGDVLVDIEDDPDSGEQKLSETALTQAEIDEVRAVLSEIVGDDGTQSSLTRPLGTILAVSGDATMVQYPVDRMNNPLTSQNRDDQDRKLSEAANRRERGELSQEEFDRMLRGMAEERVRNVVVPSERADAEKHEVQLSRSARDKIDSSAMFLRIYNAHPAYPNEAFSALCAVIDTGDELLILSRIVANSAMSRAHAGMLLFPEELTTRRRGAAGMQPTNPATDLLPETGPHHEDSQIAQLFTGWIDALSDPTSPNIALPGVIIGRKDALDGVKHIQPDRLIDPEIREAITDRQKRIAQTVDLPPEVILGIADTKAWNAWKVGEDTWKSHLEPMAVLISDGFTDGYLWPALEERGWDPDRLKLVRVTYDPSNLVVRADMSEAANDAHDRVEISGDAYRRYKGFSEADAPTDEERALRASSAATHDLDDADDEADGDRAANGPGSDGPGDESGLNDPDEEVIASAASRDELRDDLLDIDRQMRAELQQLSESILERLVERRGARVRSLAARSSNRLHGDMAINEKDPLTLMRSLGPSAVQEILALGTGGESDNDLVERLGGKRFRSIVGGALRKLRSRLSRESLPIEHVAEMEREMGSQFDQFCEEVQAAADDRTFAPEDDEGERGSVSPEANRVTRITAARVGGQTGVAITPTTPLSSGPSLGRRTQEAIATDFKMVDWEWVYGDASSRSVPFEPHQRLGRRLFNGPEDDRLRNSNGWPRVEFLHPLDHAGCQCDFVPVLRAFTQ